MSTTRVPGRLCLECKHCWLNTGHPGFSEYTPTAPFEFSCFAGVQFKTVAFNDTKGDLLEDIRRAETCHMFEQDPEVGGKS